MRIVKSFVFSFLFMVVNLIAIGQNRDISNLSSGGKLNSLQANMDIRHYTISLDVDVSKESIRGFTEVDVLLANAADTLLLDLINFYQVSSILVNGKEHQFTHTDNKLYIVSEKGFQKGKQS
ncbi:MAG: hypothetical protein RL675_976 [Bacteroidota bacterium]